MCGIIGYVGSRPSRTLLIAGARAARVPRLRLGRHRAPRGGRPRVRPRRRATSQNLKDAAGPNGSHATTGLGHTRWATHGGVTEENAHPLTGCDDAEARDRPQRDRRELPRAARPSSQAGRPHVQLRDRRRGRRAPARDAYDGDLVEAVRAVYARLEGHFTFVVIHHDHPNRLVGVRRQTPLVVGLGEGENFLASNLAAFLAETRRVQFPDDGEIVEITPERRRASSDADDGEPSSTTCVEVDWDDEAAERAGYETFMLKEIYEQPEALPRRSATASATACSCRTGSA